MSHIILHVCDWCGVRLEGDRAGFLRSTDPPIGWASFIELDRSDTLLCSGCAEARAEALHRSRRLRAGSRFSAAPPQPVPASASDSLESVVDNISTGLLARTHRPRSPGGNLTFVAVRRMRVMFFRGLLTINGVLRSTDELPIHLSVSDTVECRRTSGSPDCIVICHDVSDSVRPSLRTVVEPSPGAAAFSESATLDAPALDRSTIELDQAYDLRYAVDDKEFVTDEELAADLSRASRTSRGG